MDVEGDFSSLEATAFNMSVKDSILRPSVESGIVFDDKKDIQDARFSAYFCNVAFLDHHDNIYTSI